MKEEIIKYINRRIEELHSQAVKDADHISSEIAMHRKNELEYLLFLIQKNFGK